MTARFDIKDPAEKIVLTFDFSVGLSVDETLFGTPTATASVLIGRDPSPTAIFNGAPVIDGTGKWVYVPVQSGSDSCDYLIKVVCATTNEAKVLALSAVLPVRSLSQ